MSKLIYGLLAVITVVYLALSLVAEIDSAALSRYDVDATQLRLLSLTIVLPVIAVWFAAAYGLVNVGRYARKIKNTPDGEGFKYIAGGMVFLALALPITSVISRILMIGVDQNVIAQATATIINTHLTGAFLLVGFALLANGARRLVETVKKIRVPSSHLAGIVTATWALSVPYILFTLSNPSREVAVRPDTVATYYMPDWLIVTTIILPYLIIWASGFYAVYLLHSYHKKVGGKLYRRALKKLSNGFTFVILASILIQLLTPFSTTLVGWGVGAILMVVYALLVVISVGYVLIALGAKDLKKLEEVT